MNSLKDFGQNVFQLQIMLFVDLAFYHFLFFQKRVEFLLCVFNILLNGVKLLFLVFLQILNEFFSVGIHRPEFGLLELSVFEKEFVFGIL